jgi:hypothetical protein
MTSQCSEWAHFPYHSPAKTRLSGVVVALMAPVEAELIGGAQA